MIIFVLFISSVSAGFLDGFFSEESDNAQVGFVDAGIKGNKSTDWKYLKNLTVSVTEKGTTLINKGEINNFYTVNKPSTSMDKFEDLIEWDAPYTIEFDIVSDNGSAILITDNENCTTKSFEQLGVSNNSHIKIVNDGSTVKYYTNGMSEPVYTYDGAPIKTSAIRFVMPPKASLTYKNFSIS